MKILIISQYFWPESFRINDLALSLDDMGHEITVLTGLPNYPSGAISEGYGYQSVGKDRHNNVTIYRVPLIPRMKSKSWQLILNYISFVLTSCILGPFYCRDNYDVIFVYEPSPFTVGIPGVLFRFLKKAPMIFWVQDLWPESIKAAGAIDSKFILNLVSKMVKWIYYRCDLILVQSESFIKPAVDAGADPNKTFYFPNWAEDFYKPISLENTNDISDKFPKGFIVLFAGNLGEAQSLNTITSAALRLKHLKDLHWVIIGDGRRKEWMENEVKKLGIEQCMYFLGRKPTQDMPKYFSHADTLLVTLKDETVFSQTIPSKVQSYMACARPIIGSLNGEGARVINESAGGVAVNAEDEKALAEAILSIYNLDKTQRDKMGECSYNYYKLHYDRSILLDRLVSMMNKLTSK